MFEIKLHEDDGPFPIDLRELYKALESGKDFSTWVRKNLKQFVEDEDFICLLPQMGEQTTEAKTALTSEGLKADLKKSRRGGHNRKEYRVTLKVAKKICMTQRTEKGDDVREYFIECEQELIRREREATLAPGASVLPQDMLGALKMLTAEMLFREGVGQNKLFKLLREAGILRRGDSRGNHRNRPLQKYLNAGYFEVSTATIKLDWGEFYQSTTRVTGKGLVWLCKRFPQEVSANYEATLEGLRGEGDRVKI
ncbi:MAG: phage anti-repressor protein [Verrucomicrobiales bacterium]|jgi:phage anti-repressor protein